MTSLQVVKSNRGPAPLVRPRPQRIVLCGSMSIYGLMRTLARDLEGYDVAVAIPEADSPHLNQLPQLQYNAFKKKACLAHFKSIMHASTFGVVVANFDKNGIPDYIGRNTFAELAVAFATGKRIFLLQGIPDAYADELVAWGAIPLHGELDTLVSQYRDACVGSSPQAELFQRV